MKKNQIQIVNAVFRGCAETSWQELFVGFDELNAITFSSSGLGFVNQVLDRFRYAEVIFGNEGVLKPDLAGIAAFQASAGYAIATDRNAEKLRCRIGDGTVKCYFAADVKSHEKIFIMRSRDGRTRVVTGSANMSYAAFNGLQREIVMRFDDSAAYGYFKERFDTYKGRCADEVSNETIEGPLAIAGPGDIEHTPIMRRAKTVNIIVDAPADGLENQFGDDAGALLCLDMAKAAADLRKHLPKPAAVKAGMALIKPHSVEAFLKRYRAEAKRMMKSAGGLPLLVLDIQKGTLTYAPDDKADPVPMDLAPAAELVTADVDRVLAFLDGVRKANGSPAAILRTQTMYFQFLCWAFMTVFFPYLRRIARMNGHDVNAYPMFCVIYGISYGGKSRITELATKLMSGHTIAIQRAAAFTTKNVEGFRIAPTGLPVVFDDIEVKRWKDHAKSAIKDDLLGLDSDVHPAIVMSSNSLLSVGAAESRRMLTLRISTAFPREPSDNMVGSIIEGATSALFCEFVRRMLPVAREMAVAMETGHDTPDGMTAASKVLIGILQEHRDISALPYVRELSYAGWGSERAVAHGVIGKLRKAFRAEPKSFRVDRRQNLLAYEYPENANAELLQQFVDELPSYVHAELMGRTLTMQLDEMEALCGIRFGKKPFWRRA